MDESKCMGTYKLPSALLLSEEENIGEVWEPHTTCRSHWEVRRNQRLPAKQKCNICGKRNRANTGLSKHKRKYHKE